MNLIRYYEDHSSTIDIKCYPKGTVIFWLCLILIQAETWGKFEPQLKLENGLGHVNKNAYLISSIA